MQTIVPTLNDTDGDMQPQWPHYLFHYVKSLDCYVKKSDMDRISTSAYLDFMLYDDGTLNKYVEISVFIGVEFFNDDDDQEPVPQQLPQQLPRQLPQQSTGIIENIFRYLRSHF